MAVETAIATIIPVLFNHKTANLQSIKKQNKHFETLIAVMAIITVIKLDGFKTPRILMLQRNVLLILN